MIGATISGVYLPLILQATAFGTSCLRDTVCDELGRHDAFTAQANL